MGTIQKRSATPPYAGTLAMIGVWLVAASPAGAVSFNFDDGTVVRLDTTIKLSAAIRTEPPNAALLGLNTDDGERAFKSGNFISQRVDVLEEFDVTHNNIGISASAAGWYDAIYNESNANRSQATFNGLGPSNEFSNDTRRIEGRDLEILNAYAHGDFNLLVAGFLLCGLREPEPSAEYAGA